MATTKDVKRSASGRLSYRGESFPGYNKQKRTPGAKKKFAVLAKKGNMTKTEAYKALDDIVVRGSQNAAMFGAMKGYMVQQKLVGKLF